MMLKSRTPDRPTIDWRIDLIQNESNDSKVLVLIKQTSFKPVEPDSCKEANQEAGWKPAGRHVCKTDLSKRGSHENTDPKDQSRQIISHQVSGDDVENDEVLRAARL